MSYSTETIASLYDYAEEMEDCSMLNALAAIPAQYVGVFTYTNDSDITHTVTIVAQ